MQTDGGVVQGLQICNIITAMTNAGGPYMFKSEIATNAFTPRILVTTQLEVYQIELYQRINLAIPKVHNSEN